MARGRLSVIVDTLGLLRARRRLWIAPMLLGLLLLGVLVAATQGSIVAPFIYTLF